MPETNFLDCVLLVDEGNTLVKWAIFSEMTLLEKGSTKRLNQTTLNKIARKYPHLVNLFYCSVREKGIQNMKLPRHWHISALNSKSTVPFKNKYDTKASLGSDRIALVAAACSFYPKQAVLVIGTGTCITYNLKNQDDAFLGGAISPGLQMRLDAMSDYTAKLPKIKAASTISLKGDSTTSALYKGAFEGLVHEINGFIETYRKEYGASLKIMLAGGDALGLESHLKRRIFVEPQLAIYGLLSLYRLNKKK